jgi:hypothetical protein
MFHGNRRPCKPLSQSCPSLEPLQQLKARFKGWSTPSKSPFLQPLNFPHYDPKPFTPCPAKMHTFLLALLLLRLCIASDPFGAFIEPPFWEPDYTRTYELGSTVGVSWNQSASVWPRVHLRLDPVSAGNAKEYAVTTAILIGGFPMISSLIFHAPRSSHGI